MIDAARTSIAKLAWSAPVAAVPRARYFYLDQTTAYTTADWTECGEDDIPDGGETVVSAVPAGPGAWRLDACCYYSPEGRCELTITQPLPVALAIYAALLEADNQAEAGKLPLPKIAD